MENTISATQAARNFSELLNEIKFRNRRYTIVRAGKPVAVLGPAGAATSRTLGELPNLLKQLPSLGDEAGSFERDVKRAIRKTPRMPRKSAWG